jgi:hypothetical protein
MRGPSSESSPGFMRAFNGGDTRGSPRPLKSAYVTNPFAVEIISDGRNLTRLVDMVKAMNRPVPSGVAAGSHSNGFNLTVLSLVGIVTPTVRWG